MSRTAIALAVVVVIVIVVMLVWGVQRDRDWASVGFWKMHLVETPGEVLWRSDGTLDAPARVALQRSRARFNDRDPHVRTQNRHRAARILETNAGAHEPRGQAHVDELRDIQRALLRDIDEARGARAAEEPEVALERILDAVAAAPMHLEIANGAVEQSGEASKHRRREISAAGLAGADAVMAFVEASKTHTNDSQSSHDRSVNAQCKFVATRLAARCRADDLTDAVEDITEFFVKNAADLTRDPHSKRARSNLVDERVLPVLERISAGRTMKVSATGASNHTLLCLVWARIHDQENEGRHAVLRQALFDGLLDCWSKGISGDHIVCSHGIMTRLVNCLTPLDADESLYITDSSESIRNEIFDSAAAVIERAALDIAKGAQSDDERDAAAEYIPGHATAHAHIPAEAQEKVESALRDILRQHVRSAVAKINARSPGAVSDTMEKKYEAEIVHAV